MRLTEVAEGFPEFKWEQVFRPNDINFNMYSFDIIDSILRQVSNNETEESKLRQAWLDKFLKNGGFQKLLELLDIAFSLSKQNL